MTQLTLALVLVAAAAIASPLSAQGRGRGSDAVPPGHRPPPGMCRIWLDGVPPGRQPQPTDCATAVRNRPGNARVIFGEETRDAAKDKRGRRERSDDRRDDRRADRDDRAGRSDRDSRGAREYPTRMPEMSGAVSINQGIVTSDVQAWLGSGEFRASYVDADGDGRPESATWFDQAGQIVQTWTDRDRDGRADIVRIHENGRVVREIRR